MSNVENELREALWSAPPRHDDAPCPVSEDALNAYDRKFIRKGTRLEIPMLNRFLLRGVGHVIAGLGQQLVAISHRNELTERACLLEAAYAIRVAQGKILDLRQGRTGLQDAEKM